MVSLRILPDEQAGKEKVNAKKELFHVAILFGREVLFTDRRVNRSTLPKGMRMYVIRPGEDGRPKELLHSMIGEKYGTIITNAYFRLNKYCVRPMGIGSLMILTRKMTVKEYMKSHPPKSRKKQLFGY